MIGGRSRCLHKLFKQKEIHSITREVTEKGIEFRIWNYMLRNYQDGSSSRLHKPEQIHLAIELSDKYKVPRVRL